VLHPMQEGEPQREFLDDSYFSWFRETYGRKAVKPSEDVTRRVWQTVLVRGIESMGRSWCRRRGGGLRCWGQMRRWSRSWRSGSRPSEDERSRL